jgi:hypothetical protein
VTNRQQPPLAGGRSGGQSDAPTGAFIVDAARKVGDAERVSGPFRPFNDE